MILYPQRIERHFDQVVRVEKPDDLLRSSEMVEEMLDVIASNLFGGERLIKTMRKRAWK